LYEGSWVSDFREGIGKFIWNNGNYYDGNWKNNMKDGFGEY